MADFLGTGMIVADFRQEGMSTGLGWFSLVPANQRSIS